MGDTIKVDTFAPPKATEGSISPEKAAGMAALLKAGGTTRASAPMEEPTEKKATEEQPKTERPKGLPENFDSIEALGKSYKELQAELTKLKQGKTSEPKGEEPKVADKKPAGLDALKIEGKADAPAGTAEEVVAKAGLDMVALNTEYAEKGTLAPESLAKLKAVGITEDVVQQYIAGQEALAEKFHGQLHAIAGGEAQFNQMHEWSKSALSAPEQNAVNKAIESGNHEAIRLAFAGVHSKWVAAGQDEPVGQIQGGRSGSHADVYEDRSQMQADIGSKLYKESEAERKRVMDKVRRSGI
jgi:hypothetical protein